MAEIPVEKKSNLTWLWVLLAIIVIALLIWWATAGDDEAEVAEPVGTEVAGPADPMTTTAGGMTIANILQNPDQYVGQDGFSGEVTVDEVATDRGFWVTDNQGNRMFALIVDQPREVPMDITAGQTLNVSNGMVRGPADVGTLPGEALDADTQSIIDEQQAFLVLNEDNMQIAEPAA